MKREFLPVEALHTWAKLNGIEFHGVAVQRLKYDKPGAADRGSAVLATEPRSHDAKRVDDRDPAITSEETLIKVPPDMVLSLKVVEDCAKSDKWLREVLYAVEDFGRVYFLLSWLLGDENAKRKKKKRNLIR
jgi:hypothetical protein